MQTRKDRGQRKDGRSNRAPAQSIIARLNKVCLGLKRDWLHLFADPYLFSIGSPVAVLVRPQGSAIRLVDAVQPTDGTVSRLIDGGFNEDGCCLFRNDGCAFAIRAEI